MLFMGTRAFVGEGESAVNFRTLHCTCLCDTAFWIGTYGAHAALHLGVEWLDGGGRILDTGSSPLSCQQIGRLVMSSWCADTFRGRLRAA